MTTDLTPSSEETAKEIWNTLSVIDCSDHAEKKGNLTYLSWTWAWATLMGKYPDSSYMFLDNEYHADGSVTVHVLVRVKGIDRRMWLPVMDNRNNAVKNPDSRKISDAKMRCLVKALAMFGLGHYIYAGEDLPATDTDAAAEEKQTEKFRVMYETFDVFLNGVDNITHLEKFWRDNKEEVAKIKQVSESQYQKLVDKFKEAKSRIV